MIPDQGIKTRYINSHVKFYGRDQYIKKLLVTALREQAKFQS